ncbi:elongator complex protein 5-like [Panonychus citri]|uniref:elongator complex protein 5-like n=1 Tax=Panonychus citri TaxID=50023 RepID=UPI002306EE68|nr:elongator complex protein 5-like [Panonychus citri]XP_053200612.1 elongator complex protein 5-like [Panonychus citri]
MSVKVNNLLFRLITGTEGNRSLICITDGTKKRIGSQLLKNFINNTPDQGGHFLLLDNPIENFKLDPSAKIKIHQCLGSSIDCFDDLQMIKSIPSGRELFIDSLLPLFNLYPEESAQILSDLKKKFTRIVALVSLEALNPFELSIIKDLAGSIIDVTSNGPNYEALIIHRKSSGRIGSNLFKVKEFFTITDNKFSYVKDSSTDKLTTGEQTIEDLPFNLRPEDDDNLVKKTKTALTIKPNEGGKVYYEPGKEDDVDEEDPDEDLLI